MTNPTEPFSWQDHPCPPWCEQDHRDHDHVEDRIHRGASTSTSLTLGRPPEDSAEELTTFLEQPVGGSPRIVVAVAEAPVRLDLGPDGAAALERALARTRRALGQEVSPETDRCPRSSAAGSP